MAVLPRSQLGNLTSDTGGYSYSTVFTGRGMQVATVSFEAADSFVVVWTEFSDDCSLQSNAPLSYTVSVSTTAPDSNDTVGVAVAVRHLGFVDALQVNMLPHRSCLS